MHYCCCVVAINWIRRQTTDVTVSYAFESFSNEKDSITNIPWYYRIIKWNEWNGFWMLDFPFLLMTAKSVKRRESFNMNWLIGHVKEQLKRILWINDNPFIRRIVVFPRTEKAPFILGKGLWNRINCYNSLGSTLF